MEKKPSEVADVDEFEERQARLAAREAKKQERLRAKFAKEAQRVKQGWIDVCKQGQLEEEEEQQRRDIKDAEVVQRTQEQYKRMSKWQQAIGATASEKGDASAAGSQTWQTSMLDASALGKEESQDKASLKAEHEWGRQSKYLQDMREGGATQMGWHPDRDRLLQDLLDAPQKDNHPLQQFAPIENRKVRILALHGTPGNSNIMKFATTQMRKNTKVEWLFLEAPNAWEPSKNPNRPSEEPVSDFEKRIANGRPFLKWLDFTYDAVITNGEECCEYLDEQCRKLAPIDFVVAFSQAATLVSIFIDRLRNRGEAVPWRLSIFFSGGQIHQDEYIFRKSHPHPVVAIYGGKKDFITMSVTTWVPAFFSDLRLIEHQDGHVFPTTQPRAAEVYNEIAAQIWTHAYAEVVD